MSADRANQLIEAGLWLQMSGDAEGARRLFEQALRMDPNNERVVALLTPAGGAELPSELQRGAGGADWAQGEGTPGESPSSQLPLVAPMVPAAPAVPAMSAARLVPPVPALAPAPPPPVSNPPSALPSVAPLITPATAKPSPVPVVYFEARSAWDHASGPAAVQVPLAGPETEDVLDILDEGFAPPPPAAPPPAAVASAAVRNEGSEVDTLLQGAQELVGLDDHSGALELILKALRVDPKHPELLRLKAQSEATLQAMYESKLGDMGRRPRVLMSQDEIIWLNLDHRAGFVLAQIDGSVSLEELFLVSGMSALDTARILAQLKDERVIG